MWQQWLRALDYSLNPIETIRKRDVGYVYRLQRLGYSKAVLHNTLAKAIKQQLRVVNLTSLPIKHLEYTGTQCTVILEKSLTLGIKFEISHQLRCRTISQI